MKTTTISLTAALVLISGKAHAQNYIMVTEVPEHVYLVRGGSFRTGDLVSIEPSWLLFYGPVHPPFALVARGRLGLGGSGVGIGLAMNLAPPDDEPSGLTDGFFMGPFVSLEGHVERMYGLSDWRSAAYAGPQLSASIYILKASVGWMVNVSDKTDHHGQVGIGVWF